MDIQNMVDSLVKQRNDGEIKGFVLLVDYGKYINTFDGCSPISMANFIDCLIGFLADDVGGVRMAFNYLDRITDGEIQKRIERTLNE